MILKNAKKMNKEDFIILKGVIQGYWFVAVNIYSPNKTKDQCIFFEEIQKQLN